MAQKKIIRKLSETHEDLETEKELLEKLNSELVMEKPMDKLFEVVWVVVFLSNVCTTKQKLQASEQPWELEKEIEDGVLETELDDGEQQEKDDDEFTTEVEDDIKGHIALEYARSKRPLSYDELDRIKLEQAIDALNEGELEADPSTKLQAEDNDEDVAKEIEASIQASASVPLYC
eukprot:Colp12_sorted_trinity150504_noHs@17290